MRTITSHCIIYYFIYIDVGSGCTPRHTAAGWESCNRYVHTCRQTNKQTCLSDLAWDLAWILDLSTYQNTSLLSENLLVGYIYTLKQTNKQTYLSNLAWVLHLSSIIAYITVVWDVTRGSYRDIGQYLRIFFLAKHHLSCKNWLLIYKYKKKNSKISSKSEEIINFCYACIKWGWG